MRSATASAGPHSLEELLRRIASDPGGHRVRDDDVARYEARRVRRERRERLTALGLDAVLSDEGRALAVDDSWASTAALERVRRWVAYQAGTRARGSRPIVVMLGPVGCGKTLAGAWLLMSQGGRYVSASELAALQVARWGAERERYAALLGSRVLVVDELGMEAGPGAVAAVHEVVDRRQSSPRLTLFLGNVRREELARRYDARTIDRLRACASVIELEGESMRRGRL